MTSGNDKFRLLMDDIIFSEMSPDDQTEYQIEGREFIDHLLGGGTVRPEPGMRNKLALGISPEAIDAIKVVTSFGALIISCISLYLEIRKNKNAGINQAMEKTEALRKLKAYMEEQHLAPELQQKINDRYADQIIDTLESLS